MVFGLTEPVLVILNEYRLSRPVLDGVCSPTNYIAAYETGSPIFFLCLCLVSVGNLFDFHNPSVVYNFLPSLIERI